ncbi:MAG: chorismate mutase [Limnochordia bacterium]|jgi:chorismate mutase|nr:chorismate mutase [Bacillota bacterium]HOB07889.1 chorismate mutase [Limnochordia bacterium]NLH31182.1 chorismate mutase [Bacillota bacterium]HPT93420.1 chorismate mutase [Limnochordia bacterium]HPZ29958.1 chorismate mutase [Limnochordia bacterium]
MDLVRAIRGAVTVAENNREHIIAATKRLLSELMRRNNLCEDDLISMLFTVTTDLDQAFPAQAAREMGLVETPLMCATEIAVPGSLPRCIRVMIHCHSNLSKREIQHVYLGEAAALRPDLAGSEADD